MKYRAQLEKQAARDRWAAETERDPDKARASCHMWNMKARSSPFKVPHLVHLNIQFDCNRFLMELDC